MIFGSALVGAVGGLGGWALAADARRVPGRDAVDLALGRCDPQIRPAEAEPGIVIAASFFSAHRRRTVGYTLAYPPNVAAGTKLPVCLVLHGFGADHRAPFDAIGYHRLLAAAVLDGVPPFVLASADGGQAYWHPRADGDDPLGMLFTDFPVVLAQHGLPTDRFGVLGWSMGGYGALLAATEYPERVVAVAANAPALWSSFDEAHGVNPRAFDSADDWRQWGDMRTRASLLAGIALRIDYGESDSFARNLVLIREYLPDPEVVHFGAGCHDNAFWRSVAHDQLRLIGEALALPKTG